MLTKLLIAGGNAAHAAKGTSVLSVVAIAQISDHAVLDRLHIKRDEFIAGAKESLNGQRQLDQLTAAVELSGIGQPGAAEGGGIEVRHELKGAGENLRDHYSLLGLPAAPIRAYILLVPTG